MFIFEIVRLLLLLTTEYLGLVDHTAVKCSCWCSSRHL